MSADPPSRATRAARTAALRNPVTQLTQRIDLVLTHGAAHGIGAEVITGDVPANPPPFWASDHAGVVATVEV